MAMKKFVAATLLVGFLLAGCAPNLEKQIVGTWKADTAKSEFTGEKMKDENAKKMAMALLETVSIEIKEDKTFTMNMIFPIEGTWALTGDKLLLTPTKKPGETVSFGGKDAMDFTVESGGKSMWMETKDTDMSGKLVLNKVEAAK
jgi:hypothetical protein